MAQLGLCFSTVAKSILLPCRMHTARVGTLLLSSTDSLWLVSGIARQTAFDRGLRPESTVLPSLLTLDLDSVPNKVWS